MTSDSVEARRDLRTLPKAHLHLHFTGAMRHETLLELATRDGIRLPEQLVSEWPPALSAADEKGWFRFQRLYDVARSVLRTEADIRRLVMEVAEDDVRDGGRWLEIQVDPSGYAAKFGGITAFTDLVLDAVGDAERATGLGIAVIIASNRTRHPMDARTLARLAGQYVDQGVVGFGLSNDERRWRTEEFDHAFQIAERAGLRLMPHGGELRGPEHIRTVLRSLHAIRLGDVAIATNAFELFTEFGIQMKARSRALQTFVIQLAGPGSYVPTDRAARGGGYSAIVESNLVGPEGGQVLVERTVELINSLWPEP